MKVNTHPEVLVLLAAVIALLVLLLAVVYFARRLVKGGADDPPELGPLTLSAAARMRREGRLSEEEYASLRKVLLAQAGSMSDPATVAARKQAEALRPRAPARGLGSELVAPPGFDLTGEPLPPAGGGADGGPEKRPPPPPRGDG